MLLNKRKAGILEMESLLEESSAGLKVLFQYFPFLEEDGAVQELIQRFDISR